MAHNFDSTLPPMESLLAALTTAATGSFSAAALELGVTHAAVSRRVEVLENWAGTRLFDRHARGTEVTTDGQRILAKIEHALGQIDSSARRSNTPTGLPVVRVGVTATFARFWLLPRLALLEGSPADVRIEVIAGLKHADLQGGEVDIAVRFGRGGWKVERERRLFEPHDCPVAAPALLSGRARTHADALASLPLLHLADTSGWRAWAHTHGVPFKPKPADRSFVEYALAIEAARAGLGVALWSRPLHSLEQFGDSLRPVERFSVTGALSYYVLTRNTHERSPPAIVAKRILEAQAAGAR